MTDDANLSRGIIFTATGQGYVELALEAAESCKMWMPDVPIDLFTDQPLESPFVDQVHIVEDPWRRSKIDAMRASRFEKTIFLDADTVAFDTFEEVFDVLDRYDMCGVHDQLRLTWNAQKIWREEVPEAFPQINTGVLGYRKTPEVMALFEEWQSVVRGDKMWRDQPVFRELLWLSKIPFLVLPAEYNLMAVNLISALHDRNWTPRLVHVPMLTLHIKKNKLKRKTIETLLGADKLAKIEAYRKKRHSILKQPARRRKNL